MTFLIVYKKRLVLVSLVLSFIMFYMAAIGFNFMGTMFVKWSSDVELCHETINVFNPNLIPYDMRDTNALNEYVSCLNS